MSRPDRILFVCTGNVCRSPLAEALLRHKLDELGAGAGFDIDSVGTTAEHLGQDADPRMRKVAARNGVRFSHRARKVTLDELEQSDLIVAMDNSHRETLARRVNDESIAARIRLFREFDPAVRTGQQLDSHGRPVVPDVPDPWYGGMDAFERVFEMVNRTCDHLVDLLTAGGIRGLTLPDS